jgi:hypothetical protein
MVSFLAMRRRKPQVLPTSITWYLACALHDCSVFVNGLTWLSIIYLVGALLLCYLYVRWGRGLGGVWVWVWVWGAYGSWWLGQRKEGGRGGQYVLKREKGLFST